MTVPGHIKFWFIASVALFFAMGLLSSPQSYLKVVNKDIESVMIGYGDKEGRSIITNANDIYAIFFTSSVANAAANKMHNTPKKQAAFFGSEQRAASKTNKILKTYKLEIYALMLRVSIAWRWMLVLLIFGVAAFVDGLVARRIKIEGYGFTSPGVQARVANMIVMITGISVISFYLPINMPIVWWPFAILCSVICIRFAASNMKQITT